MGKKRVFLYGAALVLAGCVGLAGFRLASGQELYKAPELTLLEGQKDFDLLAGIQYDASQYELSVDDLGGFDVNRIGEYHVGYMLTPKAVEQTDLLPVAQAAEVPEDQAPVTGVDPDPVTDVNPAPDPAADPTPEPIADPTPEPVADPTPEPAADPTPEPVADPTPEPAADPTPEPAVDPTTEPSADPTTEPAADPTSEPSADPSQDPDPLVTELPLETTPPETVRFPRLVIVRPGIRYEETLQIDLDDPEGATKGITAEIDNYNIQVVDGGFDGGAVDEYQVTYSLTRQDNGVELRRFQRWVRVTKPNVEFTVDAEPLMAPEDPAAAELEMDFWLSGITYDETRYTLVLRDDPANLIPNWAEPQRLRYALWEGDPNALPAGDAAPAMYADPSAGGFDGPSAGDGPQSVEVGLQPAGDDAQPAPELVAVFGRDVYTTGEMEEEPKESEEPGERKLSIVAPPLVIYLEDVDPDNPEPIDLLDGVEVVDETTGEPVEDAVVAVSDPRDLADAVAGGAGGSGLFSNGMDGPGMGDPGMDGPGPGAGDPVLDEPAMTGYNILDPNALTEGDYTVELTAADPETREMITGVRSVSVQPRATGVGFAIGACDYDNRTDSTQNVIWYAGSAANPVSTLKGAIDQFYTYQNGVNYTEVRNGHFAIYLFGSYTLTPQDVEALRNLRITKLRASTTFAGVDANAVCHIRYHNGDSNARLIFPNDMANSVPGLELPVAPDTNYPNRRQEFHWNIITPAGRIKYIAGTGKDLMMAPREYGGGYLVVTGGPKADRLASVANNQTYNQSTNLTYQGTKGSGNSQNPQHFVSAGLLFEMPPAATVTNNGTLNLAVNANDGLQLEIGSCHGIVYNGQSPPTTTFTVVQSGPVNVTMNRGSYAAKVYLGFSSWGNTSSKVRLTNSFNVTLNDGARLADFYGNGMASNNSNDYSGEITGEGPRITVNGNVTVTGGIYGFGRIDVNQGKTLTCGRLDYQHYGYNRDDWYGDLRPAANSTVTLTTRNVNQRVGYLSPQGAGATLALPTENSNNSAPTPLLVEKAAGAQDMSNSKKLTLKGSQTGYTGRSGDVAIKFSTSSQANAAHYQLSSALSSVHEIRTKTNGTVGEVYFYALNWRLNYKNASGGYTGWDTYPTLAEALTTMRDNAAASRRDWRINLIRDYTLTANDTATLRGLQINGSVNEVIFMGKPESGASPTLTVTNSAYEFRMPGWGSIQFVMRDFAIRDTTTGGKGFYIAAEGAPLTIEGTWSGTTTTHLCGGYVGTGTADNSYTITGNQRFIVRNSGSGWASIAGGHCFNNTSGTIPHGTMNGAVALEVDAKNWGTTYGITVGNSYMGSVVGQTVLNGGGTLTLKGNLTSGPVSHASITKNMDVSGRDTLGANSTIVLDGVTLGTNVAINRYGDRDLANGLGGGGKLILSVVRSCTLGRDCKIWSFDQLDVSAGQTLTFQGDGGWVEYRARDGRLILHNGSTVVLQAESGAAQSTLSMKSIELPDGSATISSARLNNTAYAPVRLKENGGVTVGQADYKLKLRHSNNNNNAEVDDVVLDFNSQNQATAALDHLEPAFANDVVLVRDGGLIKVSQEHVALDKTNANGDAIGQYEGHPSLASALASLKNRKAESQHWRVSLMVDYTMTDADKTALIELDDGNALDNVQTVYLAGRRNSTGTIHSLAISGNKILRLPLDNTSQRARIVLKDFNWDNGTGRSAIAAQGRALTIEGQWSGTETCHVAGGMAHFFDTYTGTTLNLTHSGTTDVTVRNTGSGWASIVGGNLQIRDAPSNSSLTVNSRVNGATRVTIHASWPIGMGITPGCISLGGEGHNTLDAGGSVTITGTLERGQFTTFTGATGFGHLNHFGLTDRGRLGHFVANGDVSINLGSDTASFSTTGDLPINVATYTINGGWFDSMRDMMAGSERYATITGNGRLIVAINGNATIPAGSVIKCFDKLEVAAGKTLTLAGNGSNLDYGANSQNYANRDGQLILHNGSEVEIQTASTSVANSLRAKGISLPDGSATISFGRIGNRSGWGPVSVQGNNGQLTVGNNNNKLNLKYSGADNTAQSADTVLWFENQTHAESALTHLTPRFDNGVFFERSNNVVRVGTARVALDAVSGEGSGTIASNFGRFESVKDALNRMKTAVTGGSTYRHWRVSLLMDYQLTQDDLTTLKNLNADRALDVLSSVTFAGRQTDTGTIHTMSTGSMTGADQDSAVPLRMPDNPHNTTNLGVNTVSSTHYILKDMNWNGFGIIAGNGNRMTIEGTWSGTQDCWLVGGSVRCFASDFPDGNENTRNFAAGQLTVRNAGSGWAGIAGGGMIAHNGAAQMSVSTYAANSLTVEAQTWGTTWGITPGNAYWAATGQKARAVNTIHKDAGGASLTIRGTLTSGPINHSSIHNWTGGIDQGADVVNVNITMRDGFTWNGDLNDRNFGSLPTNKTHHLNVTIEGNVTLTTGKFYNFDDLRIKARGTLTIPGTGANVNHNAANQRRSGRLVLENGASVVINGSCTSATDNLKLGSILLEGNGTIQFPRVGDVDYAPVEIAQGGALTGTGHKLTVKYPDADNNAQIGDTLLKFVTQNNAGTALPLVEKGFVNRGAVSLIADSGLIKVGNGAVLLTWRNKDFGEYFNTLAEALRNIQNEPNIPGAVNRPRERRMRSRITFVEDYTLTQEDVDALRDFYLPGTKGTTNNATDSMLMLTSEFTAGERCGVDTNAAGHDTWPQLSFPTPNGVANGSTVRRTVTIPASIDKINLGTINHEWQYLTLIFEGNTEIFANGNWLEVNADVRMEGGNYPTLYGGRDADPVNHGQTYQIDKNDPTQTAIYNEHNDTNLKLESGTWKAVYGGGKGDGANVPGTATITVNGAGLEKGGSLYGGGRGSNTTGATSVTINSGYATGDPTDLTRIVKIVAGGEAGNVTGTAALNVNGGVSSAQITLKGVANGNAGNTNINVHLQNLPQNASNVTLNVYAGPETVANMTGSGNSGNSTPSEDAVSGSHRNGVTGTGTVTIRFDGQYRPNLGTVCGLLGPTNGAEYGRKATLNLIGTMTVQDIAYFENLNIGADNSSTGSVTVTGRLDSDPNKNRRQSDGSIRRWPFDRKGTLTLYGATRLNLPDRPVDVNAQTPNNATGEAKVGRLITSGDLAHLHIGRKLDTRDAQGRGTGATNPLYVSEGNFSAALDTDTLRVGTPQGTPQSGEILLIFPRGLETTDKNPLNTHYKTDTTGWDLGRNTNPLGDQALGYWNNDGQRGAINIIYAKSKKLMIDVVKVSPSRAEDANKQDHTNAANNMSWTVYLEMGYYLTQTQPDGSEQLIHDPTAPAPQAVYVDTVPKHDVSWDTQGVFTIPGGGGVLNSATFAGGQITEKAPGTGVYTATLTISNREPFTYNGGGQDKHYFVHGKGVDQNGIENVRNIALDLHAPNLTSDLSSTSNGQGVTTFTVDANDVIPYNAPQGIPHEGETHSNYNMSNLTLVGWSTEEIRDQPALDSLDQAYFKALENAQPGQPQGGEIFQSDAGVQNNTQRDFTVIKANLPEDPNTDSGKVETIFLYLKDKVGNVRIKEVPLNDHQLDLTIPTRVGVILVTNGQHTLSPICTITNRSKPRVEVKLVGYTKHIDNYLSLGAAPTLDTIGLTIEGSGKPDAIQKSIDVQGLPFRLSNEILFGGGNQADMGTLGSTVAWETQSTTMSFKFRGSFDANMDPSTDWDLFYLTYRFTAQPAPANP